MAPIVVFIGVEFAEIVLDEVGQAAAPSVTAIIRVKTVSNSLIRRALHLYVERRVYAQTSFVNGLGAVSGFEVLANVFKKIRRQVVARILNMQAERHLLGVGRVRGRNFAFFFHAAQNQIAAIERSLRIGDRGKSRSVDHAGE